MNEYERIFPSNSGGVGCVLDTAAGTTGRRTGVEGEEAHRRRTSCRYPARSGGRHADNGVLIQEVLAANYAKACEIGFPDLA